MAKAAPDGYTLGMGPVGALAISPNMIAKMPYDILRDFQPVAQLTRGHLLLAVSPKSNIRSVQELIAEAKKYPGKLTNASSANGSPGHVGGELFKVMTGTKIVHVPYRGGAAAMNDLIAGHVQLMFESLNSIAPHAHTGAVRGLAVSGSRRSPMFPDLPTIAEAGVPGYDAPTWSGIVGPAKMPRAIVMRLNEAINKRARVAGLHRSLRQDRRRARRRPAGGIRRDHPRRARQMGGRGQALGREAGIGEARRDGLELHVELFQFVGLAPRALDPFLHRRHRHHMQVGVGHYGVFSGKKWEGQIYQLEKNIILASD